MKKYYMMIICFLLVLSGCAKQEQVSSVQEEQSVIAEEQQTVVEEHSFYEDAQLRNGTNEAGEAITYSYLSIEEELNEDEIKEWYLNYVRAGIEENQFDYAVIIYEYSELEVEQGIYGNDEYIFIDVVLSKREDGSYNLPEACPALVYTDGNLEIAGVE